MEILGPGSVPKQPEEIPDLIVTLSRGKWRAQLQFEPVLQELAAKLGDGYLDHGEFRVFKTKMTDVVMQAAVQKTSLTLRSFVDQQNEALRKLVAQTVGGIQNVSFDGQVQMTVDDEKISCLRVFTRWEVLRITSCFAKAAELWRTWRTSWSHFLSMGDH